MTYLKTIEEQNTHDVGGREKCGQVNKGGCSNDRIEKKPATQPVEFMTPAGGVSGVIDEQDDCFLVLLRDPPQLVRDCFYSPYDEGFGWCRLVLKKTRDMGTVGDVCRRVETMLRQSLEIERALSFTASSKEIQAQ